MPSMGRSSAPAVGFQTVVAGVDGRDGGRDAVALAVALLAPGGQLILATIVRPRGTGRLGVLFAVGDEERAAQMLDGERLRLGVPAATVVSVDRSVPVGLHAVVTRYGADLLVVGSGHRGQLSRALLGDDARRAMNGVQCAVAIARPGASSASACRTIAVGDDGSPESALALMVARGLAARFGATVRDCAVVGPASLGYRALANMDLTDAIAIRVSKERRRLGGHAGVVGEVLEGDAGEALAELGHEVDLLVIGSRGQGPWGRLVCGSTAEYLARHATCPVLVLPRGLSGSPTAPAPGGPSPDPRGPAVAAS